MKTLVIHNSGVLNNGPTNMTRTSVGKDVLLTLHTPVIYIEGGPTDIAYENGMDDFKRISHVPAAIVGFVERPPVADRQIGALRYGLPHVTNVRGSRLHELARSRGARRRRRRSMTMSGNSDANACPPSMAALRALRLVASDSSNTPVTVIVNWPQLLKK